MRVAIGGAGQGIGAACAQLLARQGARLFLCSRTGREVRALAESLRREGAEADWLEADLATDAGAAAFAAGAMRALGGVDFSLVCAGEGHPKLPAREAGRALLLAQLEANAVAPALAASALLREWAAQDGQQGLHARGPLASGRHILVLSSLATRRPPVPGAAPYTAGKAALESLVRALAEEAWPRARINALCLGPVATRQHQRAATPEHELRRFPSPDEAAEAISPLWGPLAAGLSGRLIDAELLALDPVAALAGDGRLAVVPRLASGSAEAAPEAEPGRRPSARVKAALRSSIDAVHRHPAGGEALTRALAEALAVEAEAIVLSGGGATELLERALRAFCAEGDEVVSPFPTYELLPVLCSRQGLRHRPVPMAPRADGLFGPIAAGPLLRALGPRTRVVYVASPDNPTGAPLPPAEELLLRRGLGPSVVLVLDEAWSLAPLEPLPEERQGPQPAPSEAQGAGTAAAKERRPEESTGLALLAPVVRLRSFSKLLGLAGLRLGFALCNPGAAGLLRRLELPYPAGVPQVAGALAAIAGPERLRRAALLLRRERARLAEGLRALGLLVGESEAPLLLVRHPKAGAGPLLFSLRAAGAPVMEADWDPQALVLGLGTKGQNRRALAAAARALDGWRPE
jgi:histidinol-phosphate aminotransferase